MERSCGPMNKNWTRGAADQGERALKRHGRTKAIVTDGLRSYKAALKDLGAEDLQATVGRCKNNRAENSHLSVVRLTEYSRFSTGLPILQQKQWCRPWPGAQKRRYIFYSDSAPRPLGDELLIGWPCEAPNKPTR